MNKAEKRGLQVMIGQHIRMARAIAGLTLQELGLRCGLTRQQVNNIELGNSDTTATMIVRIARAMGIKPGKLLP